MSLWRAPRKGITAATCISAPLVLFFVVYLVALKAAHASALTIPTLALMALVCVALAMAFEYARISAVVEGTRNIFRALGRAVAMQQLYIMARLWTRLARWASQVALYRQGIGA